MNNPLFSIIVPTFNSEPILKRCLKSIIEQTFKNLEILIVDGLSTDNTIDIATSFNDPRIKIFSEKDKGIYDAMNKGVYLSKGDWIFFLGSDDNLYEDTTLEKVSRQLQDLDVVYGNVISTRFNGIYAGAFNNRLIKEKNICHQSIFFKRSLFTLIGGFNLKYKAHADWDHNMRWFLNGNIKKKYIDLIIAEYADGGFSSTISDMAFNLDKNWKYIVYNKHNLTFIQKVKSIYKEINYCLRNRSKKRAIEIALESYKLFF